MSAILTLLVPNYNRPEELGRLLRGMFVAIEQAKAQDDVDVLVVDDYSTEDLREVIAPFTRYRNFSYRQQRAKCGNAEVAFLTAMEDVETDYVWLFGNDDEVEPHGVKMVLQVLRARSPGFVLLNPRIANERYRQPLVPIRTTSPSVIYPRTEQLFMDFGFVTSTTTFSCLVMKTKPVQVFHTKYRLIQLATVYSHTFTMFGALLDLPGIFLSAPIVTMTHNERLPEDDKLRKQVPEGIRFFHHSLGLARLIRACAEATGRSIGQIVRAMEDEVDKDTMIVHATRLSHFLAHFFIEQLCREQDNVARARKGFGHLTKLEVMEIVDVIDAAGDNPLSALIDDVVDAFPWPLASPAWKIHFMRKAQLRVRELVQERYRDALMQRRRRYPRKVAPSNHLLIPLQGISGDWMGAPAEGAHENDSRWLRDQTGDGPERIFI